jgi:glycosyltransferase involved in cell wall biosynthesis
MARLLAVTCKSQSASFEQRVAGYVELLAARGLELQWRNWPPTLWGEHQVVQALRPFDGVWWQRHLPQPWWLPCLRRAAKKLVFDYDDPLTYSSGGGGRPSWTRRMRFAGLLRRCDAAFAASEYLAGLARPYCPRVFVQPMPVDLPDASQLPRDRPGPVELLWLGSAATQPYLELIRPALEAVGRQRPDVTLRLVAHHPMSFGPLRVNFRGWSPPEQEAALRQCHVGLCPMPDTIWTRGKCPYKVLQSMAWAMPWVGAAVGENVTMAGQGDDARGLCAADTEGWVAALVRLIDDADLRRTLGSRGRAYVETHHSRDALADLLAQRWREILGGPIDL